MTQYKLSLTRENEMERERGRRAKFAKPFALGAENMVRGTEDKESRGQRLVVRANPGDSRVACQLEMHHGYYIVVVCFGVESERPFIIQGD